MAEATACRERQVADAILGREQWGSAPPAWLSRATHGCWVSLCPEFLTHVFRRLELCKVISKNGGFFFLSFLGFPFLRYCWNLTTYLNSCMPLFIELFMMGTDFPKPKSPLPPPSPALVISFLVLQPTLGYFPLSKPPSLVKLPRCVLALSFFFGWNLIIFQVYFAQVPVILLGRLYTVLLSWLILLKV